MFLIHLHIKNYRGIKDLKINFNPRLNVIIGSNGCFKSTVIDAIRLFYGLGDKDSDIEVVPEDFHKEVVDDGDGGSHIEIANNITINYLFDGLSITQQGAYDTYLMEMKDYPRLLACVTLKYDIDEKGRIYRHCTPGKPEAGVGLDFNTLQLFHAYYLKAVRDSTRDLMSTKNNLLGKVIKRKIEKDDTEDEIRNIIKRANTDLLGRNEVVETKDGLNSNLKGILVNGNYNIDLQIEQNRIEYIVNVIKPLIPLGTNNDNSIRLWQNSLGFNNLIYIATVLSDIKDNHQDDADSIYALLIEEPEAHLHPQLQVNLYNFLKKADPSYNSQLFITSHSPTLTSRIPLNNLILLRDKAYIVGNCFKKRVSENILRDTKAERNLNEDDVIYYKKMIERYLDVTRSQLLYARGCVYIEGISEAQLLETFSRIENKSLSDNQIEVVNTDSTAFYQFLMLYNSNDDKKRLPQKVAFLTDGDQYTDSKNINLDELMGTNTKIDTLREKIINDKGNARVANLVAMRNDQPGILISVGYKTLEYQICLANVGNTIVETKDNDLYKFMKDNYESQINKADKYLNTFGERTLTANEKINVAIVLWKCISQKSTFAQDLSYRLDKLIGPNQHPSFKVPQYIKDAITHVVG